MCCAIKVTKLLKVLYSQWHYCILSKVLSYQGFPNGAGFWGEQFEQNSQKLHKDYKIKTFGTKQWVDMVGTSQFIGQQGDPTSLFPVGKTLDIKSTMLLKVLCHDTILLKMLVIKGAILFFTNEFATKPQPLSWL